MNAISYDDLQYFLSIVPANALVLFNPYCHSAEGVSDADTFELECALAEEGTIATRTAGMTSRAGDIASFIEYTFARTGGAIASVSYCGKDYDIGALCLAGTLVGRPYVLFSAPGTIRYGDPCAVDLLETPNEMKAMLDYALAK